MDVQYTPTRISALWRAFDDARLQRIRNGESTERFTVLGHVFTVVDMGGLVVRQDGKDVTLPPGYAWAVECLWSQPCALCEEYRRSFDGIPCSEGKAV